MRFGDSIVSYSIRVYDVGAALIRLSGPLLNCNSALSDSDFTYQ